MKPVKLNIEDFNMLSILLKIGKYEEVEIAKASKSIQTFSRKVYRDRSQKFPETAFIFKRDGLDYVAYVWTSFVKSLGEFRGTGLDYFWCIIVDPKNDKIAYCSEPYKRNAKDVILRVCRRAWVNVYKIVHAPACYECGKQMRIWQDFDTNQAMYICRNYLFHKSRKFTFQDWDAKLPPKAKDFVENERVPRERYRAENKRKGLTPKPRRKIRAVWKKTKQ